MTQRHNHGHLTRNQDDGAVVRALPTKRGWHQPVRGLAARRYDWLRSVEWREESRDRRRSDGACCPAWRGRLDSVLSAAPKNCPDRTAVHDGSRPINLVVARQPVQQREVESVARCPPLASHVTAASRSCQNRSPVPVATSPRDFRYTERTEFQRQARSGKEVCQP